MPGRIEREFAGDTRSPAAARAFATEALGRLLGGAVPPMLCDDVELVVSELVTNAVRAGTNRVVVALEAHAGRVTIDVADLAGGWPEQRDPSTSDVNGRGLPLVSALSTTWGVRLLDGSKVVWATLAVPPVRG